MLAENYLSIEPYALALPRGDGDFRLAVDRALSHIYRSGEIAAIFKRTFGDAKPGPDLADALPAFGVAGLNKSRRQSRSLPIHVETGGICHAA